MSTPALPWHALSPEACLEDLHSCNEGLAQSEAEKRLERCGLNRLIQTKGRSNLRILLDQLSNVMLLMLLAVAVVAGLLSLHSQDFPKDALAILVIVGLNALLGYLQESKAQRALLALRELSQPVVQVQRDGLWRQLSSESLVFGDLIRLEAGDRVPADARLLQAVNLGVRESALTGEAEVVFKRSDLRLEPNTPLLERRNCLFMGTDVTRGRALAVVCSTGMSTELGQIAQLLDQAGGEATPLQQRLEGLAKVLVLGALSLVACVLLLGSLLGQNPLDLLQVSLSMAVAIVPEGLPAVITVTLAIGTQRMVQRAALIRRLPAVEALGSVTVICSDKTGTLTQNRQVVQEIRLGRERIRVEGQGYEPCGQLEREPSEGLPGALELLLSAGVLCSDAELVHNSETGWSVLGDPTEGALVVVAAKAGLDAFSLRSDFPRVAEIPFSAEEQWMAVWIDDHSGSLQQALGESASGSDTLLISKGAPEVILRLCEHWVDHNGVTRLQDSQRQSWLEQHQELAAEGLRVLGFACRPHATSPDASLGAQVFLGLMAQQDPPRPEVTAAVARCHRAGIRPLMITGDHPLTARSIGAAVGIGLLNSQVLLGEQLEQMSDAALQDAVNHYDLYARVPPEQKLRIVKALQANGEVVAMSGDGVNDAPALKQAHIGVAMGLSGTEVSKEAADMVLLDDNFATIVNAIEEGRLVYANIRRFMKYILGSNVGELLTIGSAPLLGLVGVPLSPLQILWMNLVTDGVPALALALEPGDAQLMQRPPIEPRESVFARGLGSYILRVGVVFALIVISLMWSAAQHGAPWPTMVFTTLCLAQMGHALSARSDTPLLRVPAFSNPWLVLAVVLTTGLQLLLLYVPPLSRFFGTTALPAVDLLICMGVSLLLFVYLELEKMIRLWRRTSRSDC